MITHYDLFAGIGGFSLALEEVFTHEQIKHIFCEWESFPTAVLRHHWPDATYYGDIADLVTHTQHQRPVGGSSESKTVGKRLDESKQAGWQARGADARRDSFAIATTHTERSGLEGRSPQAQGHAGQRSGERGDETTDWSIVTGGFPCQPFSHAGRRKGTADDRYQWPNMFAVIRHTKPEWVIAENVRGLVTWNEGMVLETVCTDLESEGYEVQPFIIPAVAVGAPHRRDRVWIIAHAKSERSVAELGLERQPITQTAEQRGPNSPEWSRDWQEVAFATCDDSVDDGLSRLVDGVPYSRAKWRQESLKAYGNGIVHQVAAEIMKTIKATRLHDQNDL